ncbi:MAG: type VI secretion system tip protein VgrG [Polyangiaceae bacterium]|nr:type VI secretion system tip protein VgrG [Polyangiaceae bacterium]
MNAAAFSSSPQSRRLTAHVASGDALDVREFHVNERLNELFEIRVLALSENPDLDFEAVAGLPMSFTIRRGTGDNDSRSWSGICRHVEQVGVEERGLSAYSFTLVPALWLLTQRKNHRMFQRESEVDIVKKLLSEWAIPFDDLTGAHGKREYRVQYGETDFTFLCRMLEDAGTTFFFRSDGEQTRVVLSDSPHQNPLRQPKIPFRDNPTTAEREHVTKVRPGRSIRPGKYTMRDHDHRRAPSFNLKGSIVGAGGVEAALEQFEYAPGAFVMESDRGEVSPAGDDRGRFRADDRVAAVLAERRLAAERASARTVGFETNTVDLAPGTVVAFLDHPKSELADSKLFLVTACHLTGEVNSQWTCACEAVSAEAPYHPPMVSPRPRTSGVESATVVGPAGEEIHTDELGRVRVHFHWDRESQMNERSSCWIHVSQPWGGSGFGGTNLPRIGQEVIVDFLGGNPDKPVIVGRLYTGLQTTPYKLPGNKTQSGWKSRSSPGGGGDNYNEILFEDRKGNELVRMQAERDLNKLVKNDEKVHIGNDRQKRVDHDDALSVGHSREKRVEVDEHVTIGHDRQKHVLNDESVTIGHDRQKVVQHDENSMIGRDRTKLVLNDEAMAIGNDRNKYVHNDETVTIGHNRDKLIRNDETVTIGHNREREVGRDESVRVGHNRTRRVENDESVTIGNNRQKRVKGNEVVNIGKDLVQTVLANAREVTGLQRNVVVGMNRSTQVGLIDSTMVGKTHLVAISPSGEGFLDQAISMTRTMLQDNLIMQGTTGGASAVLFNRSVTLSTGTGATISVVDSANLDEGPPAPNTKKIVLDTGVGASITLEGGTIKISAKDGIVIESAAGDTVIKGKPMVKINPTESNESLNAKDPGATITPDSNNEAAAGKASAQKFVPVAKAAGAKYGVPPALILGLMSRESAFGAALDSKGYGDHGNGFGVLQVDKNAHTPVGTYSPTSPEHIDQAMGVFTSQLEEVKTKFPDWTSDEQMVGGVSAYNAGPGNVRTRPDDDAGWEQLDNNEGSDRTYSRDVWARALWFAKNLKWDLPAGRQDDLSTGHDKCPEVAAVQGSPDVTFNDKPALRRDDTFAEHKCDKHDAHAGKVKDGSSSIMINSDLPAARELDPVDCGGFPSKIKAGSPDIVLGG